MYPLQRRKNYFGQTRSPPTQMDSNFNYCFTFTLKLIQIHVVYSIEVLTLFNHKLPPPPFKLSLNKEHDIQ